MAERQLPKLHTRVRFPSPAPLFTPPKTLYNPLNNGSAGFGCFRDEFGNVALKIEFSVTGNSVDWGLRCFLHVQFSSLVVDH